jgi:hypothetical protein
MVMMVRRGVRIGVPADLFILRDLICGEQGACFEIGMNFKGIPEYDWSWGYPYGLAQIALSAILPLIWFKLRGSI